MRSVLRPILAGCALSVLAATATAQPAPPLEVDPSGRAVIHTPQQPPEAGSVAHYRSVTEMLTTAPGMEHRQANTVEYDLEVTSVSPEGRVMAITLRRAQIVDEVQGPDIAAALAAQIGLTLRFRVAPYGAVIALENWPDFKAAYEARIRAALPATSETRTALLERLEQDPMAVAHQLFLADYPAISVMQMSGALPLGRMELDDPGRGAGAPNTLEIAADPAACRVTVTRETNRAAEGSEQHILTTARLALSDGRVTDLDETKRFQQGSTRGSVRLRVERLDTPPPCREAPV